MRGGRPDSIPMLRPEAVQDSLEDGVRVAGKAYIGVAHRPDSAASRVLQDAADVPQGLVQRVVSAASFALLGCGCHEVGMPFAELVAAGAEERSKVGVEFLRLRCAGVL